MSEGILEDLKKIYICKKDSYSILNPYGFSQPKDRGNMLRIFTKYQHNKFHASFFLNDDKKGELYTHRQLTVSPFLLKIDGTDQKFIFTDDERLNCSCIFKSEDICLGRYIWYLLLDGAWNKK